MATVAPVLCSAVSVAYVVWGGSWVVVMELRWEEGENGEGMKNMGAVPPCGNYKGRNAQVFLLLN